ncbi:MAG: hypothetical protein ABR510_00095 [Trueperaceae bacterium]
MFTPLTLVPLTGPWHLRHPRWNVVVVREALDALAPDRVATTALPPDYAADPDWRETDEVALPWTVAPWAAQRGTPLEGVGAPPPIAGAAADFERYLAGFPGARSALDGAAAALAPLRERLPRPNDLAGLLSEVVPPLAEDLRVRLTAFGDGPATSWRGERAASAVERAQALGGERPALLVELDLWPAVVRELDERGAAWSAIASPPPSPAARRRALLDVAWQGEAPDVAGLLGQLREGDEPEARFLEAQLLLAHDHPAEALDALEQASHGDFREPYLLPGLLLARLGQLRDLAGRRDRALQAYRGVLALAWAPAEARAAARAGLEVPFAPEGAPPTVDDA